MMVSQPQKRLAAVLFDFDDTLIDWSKRIGNWKEVTRYHLGKVYDYLADEGHLLPDFDPFQELYVEVLIRSWDDAKTRWSGVCFAKVLHDTFASFDLDVSRIDFDEVMVAYDWRPMPGVMPYDDAIPVLETLREWGYLIGLITNSMFPMWMRDIELRAYDMLQYFDARVTSGDTGYMKPHPAIYQRALRMLDVTPEESMFVGDRPENDIAGANETGMISVLMSPAHLASAHGQHGLVDMARPDYMISSLSELLPIVAEMEEAHEEARSQ